MCAYAVGSKFTIFQLLAVSFAHLAFALLMVLIAHSNLTWVFHISSVYYELGSTAIPGIFLLGPVILAVAWALSIAFMFQVENRLNLIPKMTTHNKLCNVSGLLAIHVVIYLRVVDLKAIENCEE